MTEKERKKTECNQMGDGRRPKRLRWRFIPFGLYVAVLLQFCGMPSWNQMAKAADTEEETEEFSEQLYAESAVLMDADSCRILYGKNAETVRPMASTTKIMTCILALEETEPEEEAEVSEYASGQPKVHLGVKAGERYYVRDLLYSLMLESHNDSAVIIAEHVGGSVEGFAEMMNKKAEEIGCEDTYFITPNGLDAEDEKGVHATTAQDLARIMCYCINESVMKDEFLEITGTRNYEFQDLEGTRSFSCSNHNAFLDMMEGAVSGKTGFTADAGYCYVGALESEGRTFVVALLACGWPNNKNYKWSDTKKLMKYGIETYHYRDLWKDIDLPSLTVENGIPEKAVLGEESRAYLTISKAPEEWSYLVRDDETVETELLLPERMYAPVNAGEKIGELRIMLEGNKIGGWNIVAENTIEKKDYLWYLLQTVKRYIKINQ